MKSTPPTVQDRNRQAKGSLLSLAVLALGVFGRGYLRSGPTAGESSDMRELSQTMASGDMSEVQAVETKSELGRKTQELVARRQTIENAYTTVLDKLNVDDLISAKMLRTPKGPKEALAGVVKLDRAAVDYAAAKDRLVDEMGQLIGGPEAYYDKLAGARKTQAALLKDERAVYSAAKTYIEFVQSHHPAYDPKKQEFRWSPKDKAKAESLDTDLMARELYYEQQLQNSVKEDANKIRGE